MRQLRSHRYNQSVARRDPSRRLCARRRRATSLVEMLVVLLFVPLTLATVAFSLLTVHRADRKLIERMETQRAAHRLAVTLREDCQLSTNPSIVASDANVTTDSVATTDTSVKSNGHLLVLPQADGRRIEYSFGNGNVERRVRQGDSVIHQDLHRLGNHWSTQATVLEDSPRRLQLTILPVGPPQAGNFERTLEFVLRSKQTPSQPRVRRRRSALGLRRRRPIGRERRGVLLVVALVGLLVVGLFAGAALQRAVSGRGESRVRVRQWQSQWIADSAVQRVAAQLSLSPDYRGETWRVMVDGNTANTATAPDSNQPLPNNSIGVAIIRLEPSPDDARNLRVSITARYPADDVFGVQTTREFTLKTPSTGDSP